MLYDQLRGVAAGYMRAERPEHTLQPTALVNEVYIKLVRSPVARDVPREVFLGVAARAMRQVLVDHAKAKGAQKRGGGWNRVTIAGLGTDGPMDTLDLLALDEALERLAGQDERLGRVVELRFFGGLTIEETASALGVSHGTVESDWAFARAWLKTRLEGKQS